MKDIDFLPVRYREHHRLRRAMRWRAIVVLAIVASLSAMHFGQQRKHSHIKRQLDEVTSQHVGAMQTSARSQQLLNELAELEQFAELYTYLQHPWPRTQLLAAVAQTLPDSLTLTRIQIVHQASASTQTKAPPPPTNEAPTTKTDLDSLRAERDASQCIVLISGVTSDRSALRQYVSGFNRAGFFHSAKLESLESLPVTDQTDASRFELRLVVNPGHGQPNGPTSLPESNLPLSEMTAATR